MIGVSSAYFLDKAGHEVVLVERRDGPGLETSFANAGQVSPGYASPWAAPDVPRKALRWLLMEHAPLILELKPDQAMLSWLARTLANCTADAYKRNKDRMVRLAAYSRAQLADVRADTGIRYDERTQGTLQLFRTCRQADGVAKDVEILEGSGVAYQVLDRAGCIAAEPGLAHCRDTIVGGLRLPGDETGDCFAFTQALADQAARRGVEFRYGETVLNLELDQSGVAGVVTDRGMLRADAYVIALGSYSPRVLRPSGLRLPVYPVKGYSITADIVAPERAPVSTVLDESYKIAITRLGNRVRVGGMAEISGYNAKLPSRRRCSLEQSVSSLFPGAANLAGARFWSGLRPMTPDGTPVVGATPIKRLYLNTGHGTLGWTMACGSARVLSDVLSGCMPEIAYRDLSIWRYYRNSGDSRGDTTARGTGGCSRWQGAGEPA